MILNESQPEKSLYVFGAYIIDYLKNKKEICSFKFIDLFEELHEELKISFNQFLLTLDWLYIIGIIENIKNNEIKLCF